MLRPFDGLKDFRDPKIFWYEPAKSWYMIVSADKNMRFYKSKNLKKWEYVSQWGKGFGAQPNQFECPDFFPLAVDGDKSKMKYVMIVNINPGFVLAVAQRNILWVSLMARNFIATLNPKQ